MPAFHWRRLLQPKVLFAWENIPTRASSTSWLDGLRGWAAVQVFFFHFFAGRHVNWARTYGSTEEDRYIWQLPIFRILYGGDGAVSTFFVISGYAITYKSLTLLRQQQYEDLYNGLCSSLFRRAIRLYLPVFLLAIPSFIVVRALGLGPKFMPMAKEAASWPGEMFQVMNTTDIHLNPFKYPKSLYFTAHPYVPAAWTIPMEYYGSIVCYTVMMIVSRIDVLRTRNWIIGGTCVYAIHHGSWWTSNFLFGMLLADIAVEKKSEDYEASEKTNPTTQKLWTALYTILFLFGFYLNGMPAENIAFDFAPAPKVGYLFLYKMFPPSWLILDMEGERWYWYWSGNLVFLGASQLSLVKRGLNSKVSQWLGKLSFSLYLVHSIIFAVVANAVAAIVKTTTQRKGVICLAEFVVVVPVVIVVAGVFERYVDQPSVQLGKWLENRLYRPSNRNHPLESLGQPLLEAESGAPSYPL